MKPWLLSTLLVATDARLIASSLSLCRCVHRAASNHLPPHPLPAMSSADEVSSLRAKVAELEGKLAAAEAAAATSSSSAGTGVVRTKIDKLSSVVVDTNPYSRLMALKAMVRTQGTPRCFQSHCTQLRTALTLHAALPSAAALLLRCTVDRASCRTTSRFATCRLRSSAVAVWAALRPRC